TVSELEDYVARMRPHLAMNEQTVDFLGFLVGRTYDGEGDLPAPTRAERVDAELGLVAAMALMPEWARRMTGTYQSPWVDRAVLAPVLRARAAAVRWAIPELPCVVMARERADGGLQARTWVHVR
ncbi:MAG: hypothetical protein KC668_29250, partial [Myxococcales bacterium]|nr:hypothetical protein [Myxococcales bacterium]